MLTYAVLRCVQGGRRLKRHFNADSLVCVCERERERETAREKEREAEETFQRDVSTR